MIIRTALLAAAMSASMAFGQLTSNSVTVSASRSMSAQADQAVFAIFVDSGVGTSLDDILAALQGSGITIANFAGVSTLNVYQPVNAPPVPQMLEWVFGLTAPLGKTKDTISMLSSLQQGVMQKNQALKISFKLQGTGLSQQLQQGPTCATSDLIADARAKAQALADAAGLTVGAVLAMSSSTSTTVPSGSAIAGLSIGQFYSQSGYTPYCSLTVSFALGRF